MQTNKNTIQKELENRIIRLERELEIEAALERVRSRSLAMHKSEELSKVVQALYKEIFGLGIDIYYINISTDFSIIENGMNIWMAADGRDYLQKFHIPYIKHSNYLEHPIIKRFIKALKNETEFYTESYSQRLKNEYFNSLIENSDLKNTTKERQDNLYNAPGLVRSVVKSKNSILIIDRLQLEEFSKEEEEIFKRFGKVFEQAYTRFLDLQKAEAQAREAQIEAALEKVRSRSLAMHKSDELQEVVNTVFTNLKVLNIQIDTASILLLSEQNADLNIWIGIESDRGYSTTSIHVPEINDPDIAYFSEVIKTRKDLFTKSYTYEEKNKLWNHLFKHSGFKIIPDERKKMILDAKSYIISIALYKNTGIQLIRYSGLPFSEKENETLQRLGKVFEQAYVRFLDLQKAEAQAREAEIELA
ncbi:hypothetical protein EGI22_22800, partial [Lacihabitans sp. LS3-19]|uniref:hypothetical protein n=1 Tax=Lacihabitans sp. LS3-19 TaxID=2487335 RepID=UPI0020CF0C32